MSQNWVQRLVEHCSARGLPDPRFQEVSDRRGGRTAWSTVAVINGVEYKAVYWYDGDFTDQAKQDSAEIALRSLTGTLDRRTDPPPASFYQRASR